LKAAVPKEDSVPAPKRTAGDRKADARSDAIEGAAAQHLVRHRLLWGWVL
jgi:hypothetical protein